MKWGIVGLGNIARTRHIPCLKYLGEEIVYLNDLSFWHSMEVARADLKSKYYIEVTRSLYGCDAILCAAPPFAHARIITEALSNKKHVLTEKPFVTSIKDIETIEGSINSSVFGICHNFIFSDSFQYAVNYIGSVKSIFGYQSSTKTRRLPKWLDRLPDGLLFDELPHFLYMGSYFGELTLKNYQIFRTPEIKTAQLNYSVSANGNFWFGLDRTTPYNIYLNFDSPISEWYLILYGENRLAIVDIFRDTCILLKHDGQHLPLNIVRTSLSGIYQHIKGTFKTGRKVFRGRQFFGQDQVYRHFIDACKTGKPITQGIDFNAAKTISKLQFELLGQY